MPSGTYTQKDVPEENLPIVKAGFEAQGATVTTIKQEDGRWTVIATFPEEGGQN